MSDFAFNFLSPSAPTSAPTSAPNSSPPSSPTPLLPPVEYIPPSNPLLPPSSPHPLYPSILLVNPPTSLQDLPSTHDLTEGFEGGHKTWESSVDLLSVLKPHPNSSILELGCGTSLPTLHLLSLSPSSTATVLDYNLSVLTSITFPNFLINNLSQRVKFFSGDWNLMSGKWDVIIMSETVYTPLKASETYELLGKHLRKNGTGYVG
eukprot:CAMPEP_0182491426 /NCGR_PEP_ID=MMETSP1321-20130603/876_1 /TAXON_ID=91990 /ORGANISM="Bolidomonas sp., Strain RCC1657" /LENGTH=205 /DNA_ID=CAMNT_0024693707 /DNA_START=160 /DNA_END=773 /DNA_ORIENTATION=-